MRSGEFNGARRRVALLGLATVVAALCVPAAALTRPAGALPSTIGPGEGALSLLAQPGYAQKTWVAPFESQTHCKVRVTYVSLADEMTTLMRGGGKGFDMVSASGDASLKLVEDGDVTPLNIDLVRPWKDFHTAFKSPPTNTVKGKHYGVSVQFSPNLLLYNTKKLRLPTSWAVIYAARNRGKVTVPDDPMFIADAALYLAKAKPSLGIRDPYELTEPQLGAVVQLLRSQRPLISAYWATAGDEVELFKSGGSIVGAAWPYQQAALRKAKVPVAAAAPREGITGWLDSWMLSSRSKHLNCAYKWLNYISSPAVQAEQATFYGATPVNRKACAYMDKIEKGSCASYRANGREAYYRSIRFWKTPLADCGDSRGKVCLPYAKWVQAWTDVRG